MKKIGILNQPISAVIADLGHLDTLVIADAGLPIPAETERIDLALTQGASPLFFSLLPKLKFKFNSLGRDTARKLQVFNGG